MTSAETYSRPSLPPYQEGYVSSAEPSSLSSAPGSLSKAEKRLNSWAVLTTVTLTGWATWNLSTWLMESWQIY